jgi:hypothetical protein
MSQTTNLFDIGEDSQLHGIQIIACHGEAVPDETPAIHAPVFVDGERRLVRFDPVTSEEPPRRLRVERSTKRIAAGGLPGDGTRVGPWPAFFCDVVVALGSKEIHLAPSLLEDPGTEHPRRLAFLRWLATPGDRDASLRSERRGDLVLWACSREDASWLWALLGRQAEAELLDAAASRTNQRLVDGAWYLARAARHEEDLFLAAAALKRGDRHIGRCSCARCAVSLRWKLRAV